jgi:hypothetical protein
MSKEPFEIVEDDRPLSLDDDPRRKGRITYRVLKWVFVAFAGMGMIGYYGAAADVGHIKADTVFQEIVVTLMRIHGQGHLLHSCMWMLAALFCQLEEHRRDLKS